MAVTNRRLQIVKAETEISIIHSEFDVKRRKEELLEAKKRLQKYQAHKEVLEMMFEQRGMKW